MNDFVVKDSGKRQEYKSGMRRDLQDGKPNYRLIDIPFLTRIAEHLTKGAEKYGRDNWRLANSDEELTRFLDSGMRHMMQYLNGEVDEDHAAAVVFNIMCAEHVKGRLDAQKKEKDESPLGVIASELEQKIDERLDSDVDFIIAATGDCITIDFNWIDDGNEEHHIVTLNETDAVLVNEDVEILRYLIDNVYQYIRVNSSKFLTKAANSLFERLTIESAGTLLKIEITIHKGTGIQAVVSKKDHGQILTLSYWIASLDVESMMHESVIFDYHVRNILRKINS